MSVESYEFVTCDLNPLRRTIILSYTKRTTISIVICLRPIINIIVRHVSQIILDIVVLVYNIWLLWLPQRLICFCPLFFYHWICYRFRFSIFKKLIYTYKKWIIRRKLKKHNRYRVTLFSLSEKRRIFEKLYLTI